MWPKVCVPALRIGWLTSGSHSWGSRLRHYKGPSLTASVLPKLHTISPASQLIHIKPSPTNYINTWFNDSFNFKLKFQVYVEFLTSICLRLRRANSKQWLRNFNKNFFDQENWISFSKNYFSDIKQKQFLNTRTDNKNIIQFWKLKLQ